MDYVNGHRDNHHAISTFYAIYIKNTQILPSQKHFIRRNKPVFLSSHSASCWEVPFFGMFGHAVNQAGRHSVVKIKNNKGLKYAAWIVLLGNKLRAVFEKDFSASFTITVIVLNTTK
jgi:hypothetical protein